jgi:hypothetical protein
VTDREAQPVQTIEHARERTRGTLVDDEPARVPPSIEAPVGDREQPQVRQPDRAARMPEAARPQLRPNRIWQRLDRRLRSGKREQHRRERNDAQHARDSTLHTPAAGAIPGASRRSPPRILSATTGGGIDALAIRTTDVFASQNR